MPTKAIKRFDVFKQHIRDCLSISILYLHLLNGFLDPSL